MIEQPPAARNCWRRGQRHLADGQTGENVQVKSLSNHLDIVSYVGVGGSD